MLNESQNETIKERARSLSDSFYFEVSRLIASGGVSPDSAGEYPLSTIFKVALENLAGKYGGTEQVRNLRKF
jgi:hypothetical protein